MPTFTVIIPTYNSERFIAETLDSVRGQSVTSWQLVVVDDGSTDRTPDVVADLDDRRIHLHRQTNAGPAAARQKGLGLAHGDWVIFLDHDDRLTAGAFARFADSIARHPESVVHYGEQVSIDEHGRRFGASRRWWAGRAPQGDVLHQALTSQFIATVGQACICAQALSEIGGFPDTGEIANDWALWCLLATAGPFRWIGPEPILEYRRHPGNMRLRSLGPANIDQLMNSIAFVFGHHRILPRLSPGRQRRIRRRREANCYRFKGLVGLRAGAYADARDYFWQALKRDPLHRGNLAGIAIAWLPPLRPLFARFIG